MDESVFVKFNSEEERLAALRKMVGLRKIWEARSERFMKKIRNLCSTMINGPTPTGDVRNGRVMVAGAPCRSLVVRGEVKGEK